MNHRWPSARAAGEWRRILPQRQLAAGQHQGFGHLRLLRLVGSLAGRLAVGFVADAQGPDRGDGIALTRRYGQFLRVLPQVLPPPTGGTPRPRRLGRRPLKFVDVPHDPHGPDEGFTALLVILLPRMTFGLRVVKRSSAPGAADQSERRWTSPGRHWS